MKEQRIIREYDLRRNENCSGLYGWFCTTTNKWAVQPRLSYYEVLYVNPQVIEKRLLIAEKQIVKNYLKRYRKKIRAFKKEQSSIQSELNNNLNTK